jgi:chromosome segregation ATPase
MARRWVTSGRLPVKKEVVGIPPRTRLVRLSDVAKIRPIVDPTAAITGEVRKLDLPSIPRQQQQIMADHERLLKETQALVETVTTLQAELQAVETRLVDQQNQLREALEVQLTELREQAESITTKLSATDQTIREQAQLNQREHAAFREDLTDLWHRTRIALDALETEVQVQSQALTDAEAALRSTIEQHTGQLQATLEKSEQHAARIAQLDDIAAQLQQTTNDLRDAIEQAQQQTIKKATTLIEQHAQGFRTDLEALARNQAQDTATFTTQLETITGKLEQVSTDISATHKTVEQSQKTSRDQETRLTDQETRIKELERQLEEEREARRVLSQQLQVLVQSVNSLQAQKAEAPQEKPTGKRSRTQKQGTPSIQE